MKVVCYLTGGWLLIMSAERLLLSAGLVYNFGSEDRVDSARLLAKSD
jgi:hypothetical protein